MPLGRAPLFAPLPPAPSHPALPCSPHHLLICCHLLILMTQGVFQHQLVRGTGLNRMPRGGGSCRDVRDRVRSRRCEMLAVADRYTRILERERERERLAERLAPIRRGHTRTNVCRTVRTRSGFGTQNIDGHRPGTKQADAKRGSSTHNIGGHRRAKQASTVKGRRASASTAGRQYT